MCQHSQGPISLPSASPSTWLPMRRPPPLSSLSQVVLTLAAVAFTGMAVTGGALGGPGAIILGGGLALSTTAVGMQVRLPALLAGAPAWLVDPPMPHWHTVSQPFSSARLHFFARCLPIAARRAPSSAAPRSRCCCCKTWQSLCCSCSSRCWHPAPTALPVGSRGWAACAGSFEHCWGYFLGSDVAQHAPRPAA